MDNEKKNFESQDKELQLKDEKELSSEILEQENEFAISPDELESEDQLSMDEVYESLRLDEVDLFIDDEKIASLNEEENEFYRQSIEMAIEKYEDMEEFSDVDYEKYRELKQIEKKLYRALKVKTKSEEKKGLFDYIKVWMAVYGIICAVINIFPINPFLPLLFYYNIFEKLPIFLQKENGVDIFYIIYSLLLIIPGYIVWLCMKKESLDEKKRRLLFLIIQIIITVISIVGVLLYYLWLK